MEDAWAAGLFDGEGHVQLKRNTPCAKARVYLKVGMTDEHSIRRWAAWAGVKVQGPYTHHGLKPMFYVSVPWKKAHEVMERMRPFLGVLKWEEWVEKSTQAGEVKNTGRKIGAH